MNFSETCYPDFLKECYQQFGDEKGQVVFEMTVKKYDKMLEQMDDRKNAMVRIHMEKNILPLIAIYQSLLQEGMDKEDAYKFCLDLSQIMARKTGERYRKLSKIPFFSTLFKPFCKKTMERYYPAAGWDMKWMQYDQKEVWFNMNSCVYYDTTVQYECPELCPVFCANDNTTLGGFAPKVIFERSGTIAMGQKVCDFHFKNGKYTIQ